MRKVSPIPFALALLLAAACTGGSPQPGRSSPPTVPVTTASSAYPVTITDDEGVAVTLQSRPTRLITFAPANTEIVFALGLGSELVGVSGPYDNYPPAAKKIERVGGSASVEPNLEKVVSLDPDVLLATGGGEQWKKELRDVGVPVFTINATSLPDVLHDIRTLGHVLGADQPATALTAMMRAQQHSVQARIASEPDVSCFYEVYYGPPLSTAGPGSFVYDLLERAGCDPVTAGAPTDYPTWSVERLVRDDPEVYLVDSLSAPSVTAVGGRPGFRALRAVREGHVVRIDSDLVTRPGPRVVKGLLALAKALHPEAFIEGEA